MTDFRKIFATVFLKGGQIIEDVIWGNDLERAKDRILTLYPDSYRVVVDWKRPGVPKTHEGRFDKTWEVLSHV